MEKFYSRHVFTLVRRMGSGPADNCAEDQAHIGK